MARKERRVGLGLCFTPSQLGHARRGLTVLVLYFSDLQLHGASRSAPYSPMTSVAR